MVKYAREQFFINVNDMLDNEGKSNPKSYWSLVKKLMGKSTSSPIPPLQNEATGEFVVNDEDKANLLNTFFCSTLKLLILIYLHQFLISVQDVSLMCSI